MYRSGEPDEFEKQTSSLRLYVGVTFAVLVGIGGWVSDCVNQPPKTKSSYYRTQSSKNNNVSSKKIVSRNSPTLVDQLK